MGCEEDRGTNFRLNVEDAGLKITAEIESLQNTSRVTGTKLAEQIVFR